MSAELSSALGARIPEPPLNSFMHTGVCSSTYQTSHIYITLPVIPCDNTSVAIFEGTGQQGFLIIRCDLRHHQRIKPTSTGVTRGVGTVVLERVAIWCTASRRCFIQLDERTEPLIISLTGQGGITCRGIDRSENILQ